eukprot:6187282-Pleurochrysis_carterae.AAC.1
MRGPVGFTRSFLCGGGTADAKDGAERSCALLPAASAAAASTIAAEGDDAPVFPSAATVESTA